MGDRAAALSVGGRLLPSPPPPSRWAGRAQSELDLVPCSGYGALPARAASLKQLASKNTLGLGSGRHGRPVCFYTPPRPNLGFLGPKLRRRFDLGWKGYLYGSIS